MPPNMGQGPMGPSPMGMPPPGGIPPPMGLFGAMMGLAKRERSTPMDDMKRAVKLLEDIRESDPDKTGKNVSMALSILRNGPESINEWDRKGT